MRVCLWMVLLHVLVQSASAQAGRRPVDTAKHTVQMVSVEPDVRLEVLDYGGSGPAMIFLAALGPDAHDWDTFAPKFINTYHVYAISRRGFGASDVPATTDENYSGDRLGDDVLSAMRELKIDRSVLVGWSLGGEELSSVGSRFPEKVRALVYLDAAYPYAFYNEADPEPLQERADLRRLLSEAARQDSVDLELRRKLLAKMQINEKLLRESIAKDETASNRIATSPASMEPVPPQITAIKANTMRYTRIPVPVLAIFATQRDSPGQEQWREKQIVTFERGVPTARVVRIPHAGHDVFATNEVDVIREMTNFLSALP